MDTKRKYCPHCDEELVTKVYKRHRRQYYNEHSNSWTKLDDFESETDDLQTISDVLYDNTCDEGDLTSFFDLHNSVGKLIVQMT